MLSRRTRDILLNTLIALLALLVGYLSYSFARRHFFEPPVDISRGDALPLEVIQVDILNGCGTPKAASQFAKYLRDRGFDVVEMRNYKTFDVHESLVIDRVGDLKTARKVAYALGVQQKNIIQQMNTDYYVDVSVVVGKDFASLKPAN